MKKSLLATAVAAALVLSTAVVFAAEGSPVAIDGSINYQFRDNTDDAHPDATKKINKTTIVVNFNEDLTGGWDIYARAGFQAANGGQDYNTNVYGNGSNYAAALDQFGFKYTNGNNQLKIGRQNAWIGETGLFYDTTAKVGRKIMADGLTYQGKADAWDYKVIAVQEDVDYGTGVGDSKNKLYVGHVNYHFTPAFILGTTFAKYNLDKASSYSHVDNTASKDSNLWAVNTAYTFGQAVFSAEYGKSNYSVNNKAYDFGVNYNFDDKNSLGATYFKVEDNGDINHFTTFDPNGKGMYYSYTHKFDKATSFNLFYDDAKYVSGTNANRDYTSFRTTINYNF